MAADHALTIRPVRGGYVSAGFFLALAAALVTIIDVRRLLHTQGDWILAVLIVGGLALLAINDFLLTALTRIVADGDTVTIRDRMGRWKRIRRADISHVARRSIFAPLPYVPRPAGAFMVIGVHGRCLIRLAEDDYDDAELQRLVAKPGLEWPETHKASVRAIRAEFPGSYAFDLQRPAMLTAMGAAVVLAVVFIWVLAH